MTQLFSNDASGKLAAGVNNTDDPVTITLELGQGAKFPQPTGGDFFLGVLEDASRNIEIVRATARTGDQIIATRAQEGTIAQAFSTGSRFEIRPTAGTLASTVKNGEPIDMGNSALSNGLMDNTCEWQGGLMKAGNYFAADGGGVNFINIPDGGGAPNINGDPIVTQTGLGSGSPELDALYKTIYPIGIVILFDNTADPNTGAPSGVIWTQLQTSHDRYLRLDSGSGSFNPGAANETNQAGAHSHDGETLGHGLTENENGPHRHTIFSGSQRFYVSGPGPGIPSEPNTPIGVISAPPNTGTSGQGDQHSHGIPGDAGHTHTFNPQPSGYNLIPWKRTS